jgi:hypothetical protein
VARMIEKGDVRNWHWLFLPQPRRSRQRNALGSDTGSQKLRASKKFLWTTFIDGNSTNCFGVFDDAFSFLAKKELAKNGPFGSFRNDRSVDSFVWPHSKVRATTKIGHDGIRRTIKAKQQSMDRTKIDPGLAVVYEHQSYQNSLMPDRCNGKPQQRK